MLKINWKTVLHENLLILGYPCNSNSTTNELFQCESTEALQDILDFIVSRVDPKAHEEFSNLLCNTNERKGRINYLRQMFNWSIEVIMETFNDFKCNSALFISPKGAQIYEFLGRLTTCVLKMEMKNFQKNSSSTLRPRVALSDLQSPGKCLADKMSTLNDDFLRETKTYVEHLNTLVTRKDVVQNELKCQEQTRNKLFKEIENLKSEINSNSHVKINEINEDSIALYDADLSQRLNETNCRFDKLTTTLEQLTVLCSNVQERFAKKPDDVKIDIPSSTNMENNSLVDNGKISLERMFSKLKTELLFNKNDYDESIIRKEENRVKDGIQLIESSLSQNVLDVTQTKQNLLQIQSKIVQHGVTATSKCLVNFMPSPSCNSFIASYGDGNDDSNEETDNSSSSDSTNDFIGAINDENSSIPKPEEPDYSTKQIRPNLKRHSEEIAENIWESNIILNEIDDSKFQGNTNSDTDLGSPIRGNLPATSAGFTTMEDSNKFETTYNADARSPEINLQQLSTETINKFLNRAPESDSTIFSDSDFLYQSDPNDSFFSSPPTVYKLEDRIVRAMARMNNFEKLESLSDDEF